MANYFDANSKLVGTWITYFDLAALVGLRRAALIVFFDASTATYWSDCVMTGSLDEAKQMAEDLRRRGAERKRTWTRNR